MSGFPTTGDAARERDGWRGERARWVMTRDSFLIHETTRYDANVFSATTHNGSSRTAPSERLLRSSSHWVATGSVSVSAGTVVSPSTPIGVGLTSNDPRTRLRLFPACLQFSGNASTLRTYRFPSLTVADMR